MYWLLCAIHHPGPWSHPCMSFISCFITVFLLTNAGLVSVHWRVGRNIIDSLFTRHCFHFFFFTENHDFYFAQFFVSFLFTALILKFFMPHILCPFTLGEMHEVGTKLLASIQNYLCLFEHIFLSALMTCMKNSYNHFRNWFYIQKKSFANVCET